jgi:hypothetical protein
MDGAISIKQIIFGNKILSVNEYEQQFPSIPHQIPLSHWATIGDVVVRLENEEPVYSISRQGGIHLLRDWFINIDPESDHQLSFTILNSIGNDLCVGIVVLDENDKELRCTNLIDGNPTSFWGNRIKTGAPPVSIPVCGELHNCSSPILAGNNVMPNGHVQLRLPANAKKLGLSITVSGDISELTHLRFETFNSGYFHSETIVQRKNRIQQVNRHLYSSPKRGLMGSFVA